MVKQGNQVIIATNDVSTGAESALVTAFSDSGQQRWQVTVQGSISALLAVGDSLYIGGNYTNIAGQNRAGLAALSKDGQLLSFNAKLAPIAQNSQPASVSSLAANGDLLFIVGHFARANTTERNGLAALNRSTGAVGSWYPQLDKPAAGVYFGGNTLYLYGDFTIVNGQNRSHLAAFSASDGALTNFKIPTINGSIRGLIRHGTNLSAIGSFSRIGDQERVQFAIFDATSGQLKSDMPVRFYQAGGGSSLNILDINADTLVIGGPLSVISAPLERPALAEFNPRTQQFTTWKPRTIPSAFSSLAINAQTVFAATDTTVTGYRRSDGERLAWSWEAPTWSTIVSLALHEQTLYAAGTLGDRQVVALNSQTGAATLWDDLDPGGTTTELKGILIHGNTLYARFNTLTVDGFHGIRAYDLATRRLQWSLTSDVNGMAISGTTLYLGGATLSSDFTSGRNLVAVHARTGALLPQQFTLKPGEYLGAISVYNGLLLAYVVNSGEESLVIWNTSGGEPIWRQSIYDAQSFAPPPVLTRHGAFFGSMLFSVGEPMDGWSGSYRRNGMAFFPITGMLDQASRVYLPTIRKP
jgi:trimeric autotransporter adhesin